MTVQWHHDLGPQRIRTGLVEALRERIDAVLEDRHDEHVGMLQELLRLPTVSGARDAKGQARYREAMDACLELVRARAERMGATFRDHDGMACVVDWPGTAGGSVGVAAHLDVVPAVDHWTHPPFAGVVADGAIWGRGTQDDKGPVAMAFAAVQALHEIGLVPEKDIRFLFGTLEETDDWPDMDLLLEREEPPDITLVPDGAFPIIVGEKGIVTIEWHAEWDEPPAGAQRFVGLQSGERHNIVPAEARAWFTCTDPDAAAKRIGDLPHVADVRAADDPPPLAGPGPCLKAVFEGAAAHGAFPHDGHNAALDALEAVQEACHDQGAGAFARFLRRHVADLDGAGLGLDEEHAHMGPSTVNLGIVEMGPSHAHAQTNVRFPLGLSVDDVVTRFEEAAKHAPKGMRIRTRTVGRPQEPLFVSPEDHPRLIRSLQTAYKVGTGREAHLASIAGTTYAKIFPLAVAFGPQDDGAGEPILAHQPDERLALDRYRENIRVYALALALLTCSEEQIAQAVGPGGQRPDRPDRPDRPRRHQA